MTLERFVLALLVVAVIALGVVSCNFNKHLERIDQNGRELTAWAATTAKWTTELRTEHLAKQLETDHKAKGLPADHVPPPPDPPPIW